LADTVHSAPKLEEAREGKVGIRFRQGVQLLMIGHLHGSHTGVYAQPHFDIVTIIFGDTE